MAFSRGAARHRRWLWALTACGGAASLIAFEGHLQKSAHEHGQTATEYAKERATEAANHLKKTTDVAGALLRTALSSAVIAVQQHNFNPGDFRADLAATVADLVSETPTRRHLVTLGGGYLMDWLLQLAYPQLTSTTSCSGSSSSSTPSSSSSGSDAARDSERSSSTSGSYAVAGVGITRSDGEEDGGRADAAFGSGHAVSRGRPSDGVDGVGRDFGGVQDPTVAAFGGPPGGTASMTASGSMESTESVAASPGGPASAAAAAEAAAAAARLSREAERALECILQDDVAGALLLDRPGAVPLLLRAVACGRASRGVAEALSDRAVEARAGGEAMVADLRAAIDALRGDSGYGGSSAVTNGSYSADSTSSSSSSSNSSSSSSC